MGGQGWADRNAAEAAALGVCRFTQHGIRRDVAAVPPARDRFCEARRDRISGLFKGCLSAAPMRMRSTPRYRRVGRRWSCSGNATSIHVPCPPSCNPMDRRALSRFARSFMPIGPQCRRGFLSPLSDAMPRPPSEMATMSSLPLNLPSPQDGMDENPQAGTHIFPVAIREIRRGGPSSLNARRARVYCEAIRNRPGRMQASGSSALGGACAISTSLKKPVWSAPAQFVRVRRERVPAWASPGSHLRIQPPTQ